MNLSFKRAKRVVAMYYGVDTDVPRKLCLLLPQNQSLSKKERIMREAWRILNRRKKMGFVDTEEAIDRRHLTERRNRVGRYGYGLEPKPPDKCVICKASLRDGLMAFTPDGWMPRDQQWHTCSRDCLIIARFYFTDTGAKKYSEYIGFKRKYGRSIEEFTGEHAILASLAYMLHLTAYRAKHNAKL